MFCVDVWWAFYVLPGGTLNASQGLRPKYDGGDYPNMKDLASFHYKFGPHPTVKVGTLAADYVSVSDDGYHLYFRLREPGLGVGKYDVVIRDGQTTITLTSKNSLNQSSHLEVVDDHAKALASLAAGAYLAVDEAFCCLEPPLKTFDKVVQSLNKSMDEFVKIARGISSRYHKGGGKPDALADQLPYWGVAYEYLNYYDAPPTSAPGAPPAPEWASDVMDWSDWASEPIFSNAFQWFASRIWAGSEACLQTQNPLSPPNFDPLHLRSYIDLLSKFLDAYDNRSQVLDFVKSGGLQTGAELNRGLATRPLKVGDGLLARSTGAVRDPSYIEARPEIEAGMLRLERLYTNDSVSLCKRRKLGPVATKTKANDVYFLDLVYDVDRDEIPFSNLSDNPPLIREWENGVLFIGCVHGGFEPRNAEALLEVSKLLLRQTLLAHTVFDGWDIDDVRKTSIPVEIVSDAGQVFTTELKDIYEQSKYIHNLIGPIVNIYSYDDTAAADLSNASGVNINRNFPLLWKGLRDKKGHQYLKGLGAVNPTQPPWTGKYTGELKPADYANLLTNVNLGIAGCGDSIEAETENVLALMKLKVEVFVDFHSGQPFQIAYPWGFWSQTTTAKTGPASPTTTISTPINRYCNPEFEKLSVQPPSSSYLEYIPQTTLERHWLDPTTGKPGLAKHLQLQLQYLRPTYSYPVYQSAFSNAGASFMVGGSSIDYFLSLDLLNLTALSIEMGSNNVAQLDVNHDSIAVAFSVWDWLWMNIKINGKINPRVSAGSDWQKTGGI
jgi:hypothetical protein